MHEYTLLPKLQSNHYYFHYYIHLTIGKLTLTHYACTNSKCHEKQQVHAQLEHR